MSRSVGNVAGRRPGWLARALVTAASAAVVLAGCRWLLGPVAGRGPAHRAASPGVFRVPHFGLEVGRAYRHALDYDSQVSASILGTPESTMTGSTHLSAEVTWSVRRALRDGWAVEWRLGKVHEASIRFAGQEALGTEAVQELSAYPVGLEVARDGAVASVRLLPDAPVALHNLVRLLLLDGQLRIGAADAEGRWSSAEQTPHGVAPSDYRASAAGTGWVVMKSRRPYLSISAVRTGVPGGAAAPAHTVELRGRFTVAGAGHLVDTSMHEHLRVQPADVSAPLLEVTTTLAERLLAIEAASPESLALWLTSAQSLLSWAGFDQADAQAEIGRIAGMTLADLEAGLARFADGDGARDAAAVGEWLWRGAALLRKDPALIADLERLFAEAGRGTQSRLLILDLLANAGSARAQDALRRLLAGAELRADGITFMQAVQRFSGLERPDAASGRFVLDEWRAVETRSQDEKSGVAYTLGAVGGKLAAAGDPVGAEIVAELRDELATASSAQAKVNALGAVVNLGQADQVAWVAPLAADAEAPVRAAAARALRKVSTPAAQTLLGALALDADSTVQHAALRTLTGQGPAPTTLVDSLCEAVLADRVLRSSYRYVLDLLERTPPATATLREVLEHMLLRATVDRDVAIRIAERLSQLPMG